MRFPRRIPLAELSRRRSLRSRPGAPAGRRTKRTQQPHRPLCNDFVLKVERRNSRYIPKKVPVIAEPHFERSASRRIRRRSGRIQNEFHVESGKFALPVNEMPNVYVCQEKSRPHTPNRALHKPYYFNYKACVPLKCEVSFAQRGTERRDMQSSTAAPRSAGS